MTLIYFFFTRVSGIISNCSSFFLRGVAILSESNVNIPKTSLLNCGLQIFIKRKRAWRCVLCIHFQNLTFNFCIVSVSRTGGTSAFMTFITLNYSRKSFYNDSLQRNELLCEDPFFCILPCNIRGKVSRKLCAFSKCRPGVSHSIIHLSSFHFEFNKISSKLYKILFG